MNSKIELLAPAGSFDSLKAAVINGADAVYLGLNKFSARDKADNFDIMQLEKAINYAHSFGVKVYVTMNTLIKDDEINSAFELVKNTSNMGVDAYILQDVGFIMLIKERLPHIVIHASTQLGVHNLFGVRAAKSLGIDRVILSRETTLEDIKQITNNAPQVEIECFVHGALCVSFSGNCYFSSLVSSNSGNRGKCLQLCRKKYELKTDKGTFSGNFLSPKDLCLVDEVKQLMTLGITSLKIEGRMRKPEYVAEVVRVYRKAIDNVIFNNDDNINQCDLLSLKKMFNRGNYCKAHLFNPTENIIYPYAQNHIGAKAGNVKKIINDLAYLDCSLNKGDGVKFIRNKLEVGNALISKDGNCTSFVGEVEIGDEVYITSDKHLIDQINSRTKKIELACKANILNGQYLKLSCLMHNGITIECYGNEKVQLAKKVPLTMEQAKKALDYADEIFKLTFELKLDDGVFASVSQLKNTRRELFLKIKEQLYLPQNTSHTSTMSDIIPKIAQKSHNFFNNSKIIVQIDENIILPKNVERVVDFIVLSPSVYSLEVVKEFIERYNNKAILNLPNIARGADIKILESIIEESGIESVIVNNLYGLKLCENKNIILGYMFNQLNSLINMPKIMSVESEVLSTEDFNYCYGNVPLMTLTHCVKKSLVGKCERDCNGFSDYVLTDELKSKFYFRRYKLANCYGQLINGVTTYIKAENTFKRFIDFTMVNNKDVERLFFDIINGTLALEKFTRGNMGKQLK